MKAPFSKNAKKRLSPCAAHDFEESHSQLTNSENSLERLKSIAKLESLAILNIPVTDEFQSAINLISNSVHNNGGKLVCSGMGKAGQIAANIASTFSSTGTPSVFIHPSEAQHGDLGILQKNDLLLLISNSGKTKEILQLINLAKKLYPQIHVIAITRNPHSPFAKQSNIVLLTGQTAEVCPLGLTPTTSTTVMTVIGDILVCGVMEKTRFTKDQYAKRHHGGYLGTQSKTN